ncbi:50S ribosomal protein L25/general stress protein Ctc [Demequina mangrovi]|uniref:Large ribosomal subunit protein bL25 n=1 Tax=Demequina mangrovi TaxID=1043493 RepID=A0A1H6YGP6_9MICO|nr:50S ribosomal protein L25/general stress protein Ctc [Demequina mangrovi]SEJ36402.1 large subunit ribosomal protein L25 [Demequina mangrovi]
MSDQITLAAETRTEFGKGFARRARAAGKIPAVIYGHGNDPVHIFLPGHQTMMALKHSNALLTIELEGKSEMVIAKDVQIEPVRRIIEHVDLLIVAKGEKVTVDVPVHVVGESFAGTIHVVEHGSLQVAAEATHLPEALEVSIEGLVEGSVIHAKDVTLPEGAELVTDGDVTVVTISVPRGAGAEEATEAEATEAAAE